MRRGYTLIEMLIVCVVLVLVASLALPNVLGMKSSREREAAFGKVLLLAQAGRETAIQSGRTYALTLNDATVKLARDDASQPSREGTDNGLSSFTPASRLGGASTSGVVRLPRSVAPSTKSLGAAGTDDPDEGSADLPDSTTFGNVVLGDKTSSPSEFTLHFYPDGHSEGGGFEMQSGASTRSLQIDRQGIATLTDGTLPATAENSWEAGTYVQRSGS